MDTWPIERPKLVLASSSPYRKQLLAKLGLDFEAVSPSVDETPRLGETPVELALRLASEKAKALSKNFPEHLIIGSDQVALLNGRQLTKPGDRDRAINQLRSAAGQTVAFHTGICVFHSGRNELKTDIEQTIVRFRALTDIQIQHYVDRDQPFDCAGGFKSEGLGIALLESIDGQDPNALVGLPLIRLVRLLEAFGVSVL